MKRRPQITTRTDTPVPYTTLFRSAAVYGVELLLISAFRSIEFQAALVRDKLARGITIDEILMVNAPPGYSEHHSGRAIDIGARGIAPLDEAFEVTPAFAWLSAQAVHFGFSRSEERRVGKECVSTCRSRWSPYH